jgi:hypothetical protein
MRWQRYQYHEGQARRLRGVMGSLIRQHELGADRFAKALGIEREAPEMAERMHAVDKGYQGSEKKLTPRSAEVKGFGGRWWK